MSGRKVKKAFTDRNSGTVYQPGDIYTGTDSRLTELEGGGYLTKTDVPLPTEGGEDVQQEPSKPTRRKHAETSPDTDG